MLLRLPLSVYMCPWARQVDEGQYFCAGLTEVSLPQPLPPHWWWVLTSRSSIVEDTVYRRMSWGRGAAGHLGGGYYVTRRKEAPALTRLSPVPFLAQRLGPRVLHSLRTLTTLNTFDTNTCTSTSRGTLPFGIWMVS